jgi:tripartite-type tricarboxylate transporter receptor subunit TctC
VFAAAGFAAREFPSRKVEIVVGFGPGSGTDVTARALSEPLSKVLGVPVVVTNIEGSQGLKGLEYANRQPSDGYTLFLTTQTQLITQIKGLSEIKFTEQFEPVCRLVHDVTLLTANPQGEKFKDFKEMSEYAKAHPKDIKIAGQAATGLDGMIIKQFVDNSGLLIDLVSFGGTAESNTALLGGHVDLAINEMATAKPLIDAGRLAAIAVLAEKRLPKLPDVPCTGELGVDATIGAWRGLSAKRGTDPEIIKKLQDSIVAAMEDPSWKAFVERSMLDQRPGFATADGFQKIWDDEYKFFETMSD